MSILDLLSAALLVLGALFFFAGTIGVLRFPDVYNRLHALTKADNLGLGLVVAGSAIESGSLSIGLKLVFAWLLVMISGSVFAQLVGREALRSGTEPVRGQDRERQRAGSTQ